ncbi:hypothetical protein DVH24_028460 [Malus domestica]|uniref:Uncharacterized protein n=1 Tax=Malus domestica TaxID=3750 RepID=A0A498HH58_MALDO|nr:hypothetical protein DVH24_028460 [Malus domestica]
MQQCRKLRVGHRKMSDPNSLDRSSKPCSIKLLTSLTASKVCFNSPLPEFLFKEIGDNIPAEMLKENFRTYGAHPPIPNAWSDYRLVWSCDA